MKILLVALLLPTALIVDAQKKKSKVVQKETTEAARENVIKEVELSKEVDAPNGATIRIVCNNQNIDIRRSTSNKVKLSTKIEVDKTNTQTNDELLEKFGISMHALNNRVDISARDGGNNMVFASPADMKNWSYQFNTNQPALARADRLRSVDMERQKRQAEVNEQRAEREKERMQKEMLLMKNEQKLMLKRMSEDAIRQEQFGMDIKQRSEILSKLEEKEKEGKLNKEEQIELSRLREKGSKIYGNGFQVFSDNDNFKMFIPQPPKPVAPTAPHPPVAPGSFGITIPQVPNVENLMKGMNFNYSFNRSIKSNLTIYVPADVKLDIENKYGNVNIADDYKEATINISNGSLDARKISSLKLISKYTTVNIGDIDDAEIELENGNLTAGNIKDLDIDSKFSTIEFDNGNSMIIRSQNDNYTIENLDKLEGRKSYGTFRLNKLGKSFNLDGQNADLRIKNFAPAVDMVKVNDKYADIRLPVKDLQNYSVNFEGEYSTVYGPFEKHKIEQAANSEKPEKENYASNDNTVFYMNGIRAGHGAGETSPNFNASVGNVSGAHTAFNIKCNQCTVDFK